MKIPAHIDNFKKSSIEGIRDLKEIPSMGDVLAIFLPSYSWWRPASYDIWHDMTWRNLMWFDVVWSVAMKCGVLRCDVLCDVMWGNVMYDVTWCAMWSDKWCCIMIVMRSDVWCDLIWCGVACCLLSHLNPESFPFGLNHSSVGQGAQWVCDWVSEWVRSRECFNYVTTIKEVPRGSHIISHDEKDCSIR